MNLLTAMIAPARLRPVTDALRAGGFQGVMLSSAQATRPSPATLKYRGVRYADEATVRLELLVHPDEVDRVAHLVAAAVGSNGGGTEAEVSMWTGQVVQPLRPTPIPAVPTAPGPPSAASTTIVVGIDDPGESSEVIDYAGDQARAGMARLHVVHAYRDLAHVWRTSDAVAAVEEHRHDAEAGLAAAADDLRSRGLDVEHQVRAGRPADILASVAREQEADMIVIGAGGRRRRRRLGRIARELTWAAPCPVLVVPHVRDARAAGRSAQG